MSLITQVKSYEAKLAIQSTKLKFSPFDANTECLVMQDARLLSEKLKMILFFFLIFFICKYILQVRIIYQYVIQQFSKYTMIKHKFIPYRLHDNVSVVIQLKQVKSYQPKNKSKDTDS
jgi:hypothetical protein